MLASGAAATTFAIVPRHVLGGPGFVPPSEKINLAYIGCGTQGLREMLGMLAMPEIQIVAVCDPVKDGHDYVDWSKDELRASIATALGKPDWRAGRRKANHRNLLCQPKTFTEVQRMRCLCGFSRASGE
jgi:hypothetical protein